MREELEKGFFELNEDDLYDYIEQCRSNFVKNEDYTKIYKRIEEIKECNPSIDELVKNRKAKALTEDEVDKLLELVELYEKIYQLDIKNIFRLGMREACIIMFGNTKKY